MSAIRKPVNYRFESLNWNFIRLIAEIAFYAGDKYGAPEQYTESPLEGDKSPINHLVDHVRAYLNYELHDHFITREHQLAAIAYNAMMEYYYLKKGWPTVTAAFVERKDDEVQQARVGQAKDGKAE